MLALSDARRLAGSRESWSRISPFPVADRDTDGRDDDAPVGWPLVTADSDRRGAFGAAARVGSDWRGAFCPLGLASDCWLSESAGVLALGGPPTWKRFIGRLGLALVETGSDDCSGGASSNGGSTTVNSGPQQLTHHNRRQP